MTDSVPAGLEAGAGDSLFFGIAVSTYDDGHWKTLAGAAAAASRLEEVFAGQGFKTRLLSSPTRSEVIAALSERDRLQQAGFTGPLVLVWTGHGDAADDGLTLIVRDTPGGAGREQSAYSPEWLVKFLLDAGSTDSLVIIDACSAGAGDTELVARHIKQLERATWPGQEPSFACVVSCKGYERASDGAFLTELVELLTAGPVDVEPGPYDLLWGPHSARVPLGAVLDTIGRRARVSQRPRFWQSGASNLSFHNPRFQPSAPAALVDDQVRATRGQPPRPADLVQTPASAALAARLLDSRRGLWVLSGRPGSGKTTCLQQAAAQAPGTVRTLAPTNGPSALAAAIAQIAPPTAVALDALDEAPSAERGAIAQLALAWAQERFVVVTSRPCADEQTLSAVAEQAIDVAAPQWQGDAIERYVAARLGGERDGER